LLRHPKLTESSEIRRSHSSIPADTTIWDIFFKYNEQDAMYKYSLLLSMLYMFQAVSPPIIRSSKTA